MSQQTINRAQSISALKTGGKLRPHSQYHIYFAHQIDRHHVSAYSESVLRAIMQKAGVHSIIITSTVRTEREQAEVMLHNLQSGVNVGYARAGESVKAVATRDIADGKSADEIIADMLKQIDKVGFSHVTKHAASSGMNTVDISGKYLKANQDADAYDNFVEALQNAVAANQISRFGWPEGPPGNGRCFNDKGCLHVEIVQPATEGTDATQDATIQI